MKLTYLKWAYKFNSFDVSIGIKIPFFRLSVTIEPRHSLTTVCFQELFDLSPLATWATWNFHVAHFWGDMKISSRLNKSVLLVKKHKYCKDFWYIVKIAKIKFIRNDLVLDLFFGIWYVWIQMTENFAFGRDRNPFIEVFHSTLPSKEGEKKS